MIEIVPIGIVRGGRAEALDDAWGEDRGRDRAGCLRASTPSATAGLSEYSHIVVLFHMHKVPEAKVETGARHPRERADWPKSGIFAQPARSRPNRIGVTTVELLSVDGLTLRVRGLDAIDGSPVLDIKPYISGLRTTRHDPRAGLGEGVNGDAIGELINVFFSRGYQCIGGGDAGFERAVRGGEIGERAGLAGEEQPVVHRRGERGAAIRLARQRV